MKTTILTLLFILGLGVCEIFAQRPIRDYNIEAQQRRNVYLRWGDFRPNPKRILGIQVNPYYTLVWSWADFDGDRGKYRKGPDIRPLRAGGEQTQREASLLVMASVSDDYRKQSEEALSTAVKELLHNTGGVMSEADPMWFLYYKKTLKDVDNYSLSKFTGKLSNQQKSYLLETKIIQWLDEEMLKLHERLHGAKAVNMDRGSRILNYHRIMLEYEKILGRWNHQVAWAERFTAFKNKNSGIINIQNVTNTDWHDYGKSELQIMQEILRREKRLK